MVSSKQKVIQIWHKHYTTLFALANNLVQYSHIQADDLMQELALKILNKCEKVLIGYEENGVRYLNRMLKNTFIDLIRKDNVAKKATEMFFEKYKIDDRYVIDESAEYRQILVTAIQQKYDEKTMGIFVLYTMGYSYDEIAEIMEVPKNTVGTKIFRIKKWLTDTDFFD